MLRLIRLTQLLPALFALTAAAPASSHAKWPPWLSIESPVNPFDSSTAGAVFLVHAATRDGAPGLASVSGSAEGLVDNARRTIALRFDATSIPGVFAVRKQWPTEGTWIVRVSLASTTAIVVLDRAGNVASVRVPTTLANGRPIPRAVVARDIDSTLTVASVH
jgi:hypothetical protein